MPADNAQPSANPDADGTAQSVPRPSAKLVGKNASGSSAAYDKPRPQGIDGRDNPLPRCAD